MSVWLWWTVLHNGGRRRREECGLIDERFGALCDWGERILRERWWQRVERAFCGRIWRWIDRRHRRRLCHLGRCCGSPAQWMYLYSRGIDTVVSLVWVQDAVFVPLTVDFAYSLIMAGAAPLCPSTPCNLPRCASSHCMFDNSMRVDQGP